MTAVKDFIVAIELGSSKLTGMAGKRNSDGSIQIFAYAREEASAFIRKGIIYNINKTVLGLTSIINKLEEQLEGKVKNVRTLGDAVFPRKIINAVGEGFHYARIME